VQYDHSKCATAAVATAKENIRRFGWYNAFGSSTDVRQEYSLTWLLRSRLLCCELMQVMLLSQLL
jgi:hypothetical protein